MSRLSLWLRFALRDLRSGLQGFWIFLICLTLGTAAIAIIGSLSASLERGLNEQGQPLLGGDLEFALVHQEMGKTEYDFLNSSGTISTVATLRAMAIASENTALVEIKAIDQNYPLYGEASLSGAANLQAALGKTDEVYSVVADQLLMDRLNIKAGDFIKLGTAQFRVGPAIVAEPDRISDGFMVGPRLMMSNAALMTTGLIQPGSLITWRYRVKLDGEPSLAKAKALIKETETKFPKAGWRARASDRAAQGAENVIERLSYFMTLVSFTALVIGGAGIANAVTAFINRRGSAIATYKCLGAPASDILGIYLTEIILVSGLGIAVALGLGAAAPSLVQYFFGELLPLPLTPNIEWRALGLAGLLGALVTLAFSIWPLGRTANIPATALFRNQVITASGKTPRIFVVATLIILASIAGIILLAFDNQRLTIYYLIGLVVSFAGLLALAFGITKLASLLPTSSNVLVRQAIASLHRPGSSAVSVILALGLGLTLFVTLTLTDNTLTREIKSGLPEKAPAFFFLDVRNEDLPAFKSTLSAKKRVISVANAPMLRGRIVKVKGVDAEKITPNPEIAWALRGDRGLTYASQLPEGSTLVEGAWWADDYSGPNLVSLVEDIGKGLDLKIGDKIVVNVLGRDVEAEIANFRTVNWRSLGINFVMVFSPNTLKSAPHSHIVTVEMIGGDEAKLLNEMAKAYPSTTAVRVKDLLSTVGDLLGQMLTAIRGANILTLLTGVLVLAGALAAGLSSRTYEAVVLKTYGASRRQLLTAFTIEYGVLGLVAALFGMTVGSIGSWFLAKFILEMPWQFSASTAILTALIAMVLTIVTGLLVTNQALRAKPAGHLRNE